MKLPRSRQLLAVALAALAALFGYWIWLRGSALAGMTVFVAPPLLLMAGVLAGSRLAAFWSGVLGLAWFCHGVMEAWSTPAYRLLAWLELLLALAVILAASWPGLAARFAPRRPGGPH